VPEGTTLAELLTAEIISNYGDPETAPRSLTEDGIRHGPVYEITDP
jgi:hypothetical protein